MKLHTFLSLLLAYSTQASSLPKDVRTSLISRASSTGSISSMNSSIEWSKCDLDFGVDSMNEKQKAYDCARLEVPLDHTSASNGDTIRLDLIRVKATKEPFKGSVLYNPGGPGGSGVEAILRRGPDLSRVLGGQFDVISFDPRGTGRTIPFICNATTGLEANETELNKLRRRESNNLPQADIWKFLETDNWKQANAIAEQCFKTRHDIGRFVNTPFVARDMISIVDALDQGPKLNYWGVSYGTVLGQVAASMFPERVGRVLLDANLKAEDYAANVWISSLRGAEMALSHLLDECIDAGKDLCPLADYHGKQTTGDSLLAAVSQAFESYLNGSQEIGNVTQEELNLAVVGVKYLTLDELYDPADFSTTATRIKGLLTNNNTALLVPSGNSTLNIPWNIGREFVTHGISCSDSSFRVESPEDLFSIYQAHRASSSFFEASLSARLICASWKFSAAEQIDFNKLRNVKTSSPVLFANGAYDPVTPLSGAWEISSRFRGSRVIVHEGVGHGILNHPSNCTEDAVRKYFVDGEMPKLNTTCKPNLPAFEYGAQKAAESAKEASSQDSPMN
ncbi:alpha beta hydrolase superfamily hydrolase [Fusarium heterosporum]|uniref:Alpha beta hydrolase superfamily hydrolase n=1 Tax=Fusarium heterosporum TaxID=42747 RepID=A0A8H5T4B9_FUSHE|nr:alpha beta hydrolase superfamily hydrolase [Fusarium heterosporum]